MEIYFVNIQRKLSVAVKIVTILQWHPMKIVAYLVGKRIKRKECH